MHTDNKDTPIKHLNAYRQGQIIDGLRYLFMFTVTICLAIIAFLSYLVYTQHNREMVYFATPTGTIAAHQCASPDNLSRESFEIENFAIQFLRDAFAHSENDYQENIERALRVMNNEAAIRLKKQFSDESLFKVYQEYNGITTVKVNHMKVFTEKYPYQVKMSYTTFLKFLGGTNKLKEHAYKGGIHLVIDSVKRSKNNPYGCMITQLNFINYEDEK